MHSKKPLRIGCQPGTEPDLQKNYQLFERSRKIWYKIYWNQACDEKSVSASVKDWVIDNNLSNNCFITDLGASFIKSGCR